MAFGFIVRRIAIKKGVVTVILPYQRLKVLILDYGFRKPVRCLPDCVKAFPHIEWLASERGTAAAVAVSDQFEKSRRPFDIRHLCIFQKDRADFLIIRRGEVLLGKSQFLLQKCGVRLLLFQECADHGKLIPAVDR